MLFIFVDDILVMSKTKQVNERFRDLLKTELKIKELGKPKHILGVNKGMKVYTSMEPHSTPRKFLASEDKNLDPHFYRQLIGSLMQLATWKDQIFHIPCKFFPNSFKIQLEDTGHWLEE